MANENAMQDQLYQIIERLKVLEQLFRDAAIGTSEYLSHKDASKYLNVSKQTLYHLVSQGKIRPNKPNGKLNNYLRKDLDNYLSKSKIHTT